MILSVMDKEGDVCASVELQVSPEEATALFRIFETLRGMLSVGRASVLAYPLEKVTKGWEVEFYIGEQATHQQGCCTYRLVGYRRATDGTARYCYQVVEG